LMHNDGLCENAEGGRLYRGHLLYIPMH